MLRSDCIACSTPNLFSIISKKKIISRHAVCHARLFRSKAPWLRRIGSTMLSFNWGGRAQENSEDLNVNLNPGGGADVELDTPPPATPHEVSEIYENQRWIGTWQPPVAILDIPSWTDADGNEVALTHLTSSTASSTAATATSLPTTTAATSISTLITESPDWEVVITPSTDTEGWQYATVFKHLEYKRPGGRASQRFGDTCRRRAWKRQQDITSNGVAAISLDTTSRGTAEGGGNNERSTTAAAAAAAAAAKAREAEAKNKALRGFITMVLDLLSRRKVWTLVPWDPSALFFLYKKHQEIYQELQTQASQRQIFAADTPPPPSMLHQHQITQTEQNTTSISNSSLPLNNNGETSRGNKEESKEEVQVGTATLLQDLLCAAMHSRAAYGFAMAAGHITSVTSYIKLQTVQPLTFNAVAGASIEANNEAVAALAGIAPEDILLSHWRNFPFRPCHYVAIDRVNQCVVISIRGTLEIGDLLSDLAAHPMEIELGGVDGWVHPGILAAASYIHCTTEAALKDAAKKCPGWPVLITGHSLGGGVAALLCMLLRDRGGAADGLGPVYSITVGSAAVMSESLAAACQEYVISLVLGSDVIPHLSYASVERLLVEASEASPVRRVAEGLKKKLDSVLNMTTSGSFNSSSNAVSGAAVNAAAGSAGLAQLVDSAEAQPPLEPRLVPIISLHSERENSGRQEVDGGSRTDDVEMNEKGPESTVTNTSGSTVLPNVVPVLHEEDISILNYPSFDGDTGLAAAAMAQQQQQRNSTTGNNTTSTHNRMSQQLPNNNSNDPELLFPPGKILWIFPSDEDVTSLTENSTTSTSGDGTEEKIVEEAWDTAWEGTRVATVGEESSQGAGEKNSGGGGGGASRGVNIDEAEAQVVASHKQHENKDEEKEPPQTKKVVDKKVPVVVEADRSAFERLLLMPDCLNDHLPHRVLEALQQL
jgi:hypothetical protein